MTLSTALVMVMGTYEEGKQPQLVPTVITNSEEAQAAGVVLSGNGLWSFPSLNIPQTPIGFGWRLPHHCRAVGVFLAEGAERVTELMKLAIGRL